MNGEWSSRSNWLVTREHAMNYEYHATRLGAAWEWRNSMAEQNDTAPTTDVTRAQPMSDMTVLPPDSGFLGRFLQETENMLRARAMRMSGCFAR